MVVEAVATGADACFGIAMLGDICAFAAEATKSEQARMDEAFI
jgi:hypothetical protein